MVFKHNGKSFTAKENSKKRFYRLMARCSICWSKYQINVLETDFTNRYFCPNCHKHKRTTYNFQLVKVKCSNEEFENILRSQEIQIIKSEITEI